jgi:hypothetical protein
VGAASAKILQILRSLQFLMSRTKSRDFGAQEIAPVPRVNFYSNLRTVTGTKLSWLRA